MYFFPDDEVHFPTSGLTNLTIRSKLQPDGHRYGHTVIHIIHSVFDASYATLELRTCDRCVWSWGRREIQLDSSAKIFEYSHCCRGRPTPAPLTPGQIAFGIDHFCVEPQSTKRGHGYLFSVKDGLDLNLVIPRSFQGEKLTLSGFHSVDAPRGLQTPPFLEIFLEHSGEVPSCQNLNVEGMSVNLVETADLNDVREPEDGMEMPAEEMERHEAERDNEAERGRQKQEREWKREGRERQREERDRQREERDRQREERDRQKEETQRRRSGISRRGTRVYFY
ncbi:hypothetical protein DFH07DRAFT_779770 [Mycena maculata]|uniref:Uncharacterized protein n=1 Tax=Mycena maculata TaxID=230809 RepID=A0AAD7I6K4_9AGAR|nr:hypothetical protein DFH07DRAFT_779770 [Mycena maculata]